MTAVDRDRLITDHLPLADMLAFRYVRSAFNVDLDDVTQEARVGLVKAADRFDPANGAKFSTYAASVINGAIIDAVRRWDIGRRDRWRDKDIRAARWGFAARERRFPTDKELAGEMGWTVRKLSKVCAQVERGTPLALDAPMYNSPHDWEMRDETTLAHLVSRDDPGLNVDLIADRQWLAQAVTRLPERDAVIVGLYFWQQWRMREIAEFFNLTEPRISQIISHALDRLRAMLPAEAA